MIRRYTDKAGTDIKFEKPMEEHLKVWYDSTRACLETAFMSDGGNEFSDTLRKK
ncbi:hypothetical protein I5Q83_05870 [Enterocloster clostridioformis]|nr:hypothetical protein [Enterocloster clostridioformis]QQR01842.1 hypothetical protein I5Q83_05870 [Enterocloster clostridioformis]